MKCLIAVKLVEDLSWQVDKALITIDGLRLMVIKKKLMDSIPFKEFQKIEPECTFLVKGECYIKGLSILCVAGRTFTIMPEYVLEIAEGKSVELDGEQYKLAIRDKVNYLELICEVEDESDS